MSIEKTMKKVEAFSEKHYILISCIGVFIIYALTLFVFWLEEAVFGMSSSYVCAKTFMSVMTAAGFVTTVYGLKESILCFQGLYELKSLAIRCLITGIGLSCVTLFVKLVRT